MKFMGKFALPALTCLLGLLPLPAPTFAQAVHGPHYRAIGTGPTCEEAKHQARHGARIWRDQNCPAVHITKFSSDLGFDPEDPKDFKTPDERARCMKNADEFYIYRDVQCVSAPKADSGAGTPKKRSKAAPTGT